MYIYQLDRGTRQYQKLFSAGELRPFAEVSLMEQILQAVKQMEEKDDAYVVFSKEESAQIDELTKLVVGGLRTNQGLGHSTEAIELFLLPLLRPSRLYLKSIPADGNGDQPFSEVKSWLLAITKM